MSRNAQAEADSRLGNGYAARVLEPSPPTHTQAPWFADDPVARGEVPDGVKLVSPVSTGDVLWSEIEGVEEFCAERWLGHYRRLGPLSTEFAEARLSLHRVAEDVMKPAREAANGKFGLRYTFGGFGTPFFGADEQIRVEHGELVFQLGAQERRETLDVDRNEAAALGDWFGFGWSVLEELRASAAAEHEPSRVQLWPEHFDASLELGSEDAGRRAAYGASPGDEHHDEPYLYVAPWSARPEGELWNADGFSGAELPYAALLAAHDQRATALDFYRTRLEAL